MIDPYIHRKPLFLTYTYYFHHKNIFRRNFTLDKCITVHFQILITYQRRSLSSQLILPYVLHTIGAPPAYVTLMRKILDSVSGYTRFVHTTLFYTCRLISYVPYQQTVSVFTKIVPSYYFPVHLLVDAFLLSIRNIPAALS
jgi:hypothetical protein